MEHNSKNIDRITRKFYNYGITEGGNNSMTTDRYLEILNKYNLNSDKDIQEFLKAAKELSDYFELLFGDNEVKV